MGSPYPEFPLSVEAPAPDTPYFLGHDEGSRNYDNLLFNRNSRPAVDSSANTDKEDHGTDESDKSDEGSVSQNGNALYRHALSFLGGKGMQPYRPPADEPSEPSSSDGSSAEEEGRRGPARGVGSARGRGRGRGRSRGRARGFGLGRGSMGGVVREPRAPRGRPRGRGSDGQLGRPSRSRRQFAAPAADFKEAFNEAMAAYLEEDFDTALQRAQDAITLNPEIFAAHNLLSQIHNAMGRPKESLETLWIGAHSAKDTGVWWDVIRRTEESSTGTADEQRSALIYCYSQLVDLNPRDLQARKERLEFYLQDFISTKASRECRKMLKIWPQDLEILNTYASSAMACKIFQQAYYAKNAFRFALEKFQKDEPDGRQSEFDFPDLNQYLDILNFLKLWKDGIDVVKSASRWLCGRQEDTLWADFAEDDREWDLNHEPRRNAVAGFKIDQYPLGAYGQALPIEIRIKMGLFRLRSGRGSFAEAMRHFEHLNPLDKAINAPIYEHPDLFIEVAVALFTCERWLSCLRFYEPLVQSKAAMEPLEWARIARAYQETDNLAPAVEYYEVYLQSDPRHESILTELALLCNRLGMQEKAEQYTEKVLGNETPTKIPDHATSQLVEQEARKRVEALTTVEAATGQPRPTSTPTKEGTTKRSQSSPATIGEVPKPVSAPTSARRPRTGVRQSLKDQDLPAAVPLLHLQLQIFRRRMRAVTDEWAFEWLQCAETLLNHFASVSAFFPKDKGKKQRNRMKRKRADTIDLDGPEEGDEVVVINSDDEYDFPEPTFGPHRGLSMQEWLDIFCEYALMTAERGERGNCYQALSIASTASPFLSTEALEYHLNIVWISCALAFDDAERLSSTVRCFMKEYPFEPNTYRLYNLVHRLCKKPNMQAYADPSMITFLRRQVRLMDFAILSEADRETAGFTANDRAAAMDPRKLAASDHPDAVLGNPYGIKAPCTQLLTLLGNLLAARGDYEEAVNQYLRVYSIDEESGRQDSTTALLISTAYMQWSTKKTCENRNGYALQAMAFMHIYKGLRLSKVDIDGREIPRKRLQNRSEEVEFNEGRLYHGLGLTHLAVKAYERCLAIEEEQETKAAAKNDEWVVLDDEGDLAMREEGSHDADDGGGSKKLAAFALKQIHVVNGDLHRARQIMEKWLVF